MFGLSGPFVVRQEISMYVSGLSYPDYIFKADSKKKVVTETTQSKVTT